ncbi:MAG: hypothetical protein AAF667_04375 [Pseudomonadota bacterium]
MGNERLTMMFGTVAASAGIALWMSIMAQAAFQVPVVGFLALIPAALVVFVVAKSLTGSHEDRDCPDLFI